MLVRWRRAGSAPTDLGAVPTDGPGRQGRGRPAMLVGGPPAALLALAVEPSGKRIRAIRRDDSTRASIESARPARRPCCSGPPPAAARREREPSDSPAMAAEGGGGGGAGPSKRSSRRRTAPTTRETSTRSTTPRCRRRSTRSTPSTWRRGRRTADGHVGVLGEPGRPRLRGCNRRRLARAEPERPGPVMLGGASNQRISRAADLHPHNRRRLADYIQVIIDGPRTAGLADYIHVVTDGRARQSHPRRRRRRGGGVDTNRARPVMSA